MSRPRIEVPPRILARVRTICTELPDAAEEAAWIGWRWKVGSKTFAHILMIDQGWPPAYAKASGIMGTACVLTFRSALPEVDPGAFRAPPFFKPVWWPDIAGMVLAQSTDWKDVRSLLIASHARSSSVKLAAKHSANCLRRSDKLAKI